MSTAHLEEFAPGVFTVTTPLRLGGAAFGTRMTVIRLGTGGLLLIAPCAIDAAFEAEIRELGEVTAVIAPNCFHHLYFLDALERFPAATAFLAEGVDEKLGELPANAKTLVDEPDPIWSADLEQCRIPGSPKVNEVVFYHGASRTLIVTDLFFNFDPAPKGWTGFMLRIFGAHGKLSVSRLMRTMLKDRPAIRAAIERMLAWDFDRMIVTHGQNLKTGAKQRFREATLDL
jgi:Domain of unknown function (DUF4336)